MYVNLTRINDRNCNDNNSDELKKKNRKNFASFPLQNFAASLNHGLKS